MNPKKFFPEALTEGRTARGLNKAQLADAIGVTRQAISLFEKGESEPSAETLTRIANQLHLPRGYFFRAPIQDFVKETPEYYRKLASMTDMSHSKAHIKAKWHYNGYLKLTRFLKQITPNLPKYCYEDHYAFDKLTDEAIEGYADELRLFWGLGRGPIKGLMPLMEKNGVIVFQIDMDPQINGFSFFANGGTPFVVCAQKVSAVRNRFNLAHELAHLILHADVDEAELLKHHDQIEDQAHLFAATFLFPKERFYDEFFSIDLSYLTELKERWGMSVTAIVKRACNLGILTTEEEVAFYRRNPGIRKKEPGDDEMKIEQPSFSRNGIKAVLDANLITIDDLKSELPYGNEDLSEIFHQAKDFFGPKSTDGGNIIQLIQPA